MKRFLSFVLVILSCLMLVSCVGSSNKIVTLDPTQYPNDLTYPGDIIFNNFEIGVNFGTWLYDDTTPVFGHVSGSNMAIEIYNSHNTAAIFSLQVNNPPPIVYNNGTISGQEGSSEIIGNGTNWSSMPIIDTLGSINKTLTVTRDLSENDGTATFVSGSSNITGVGTSWDNSLVGGYIRTQNGSLSDGNPYLITKVISPTMLMVSSNYINSTATSTISIPYNIVYTITDNYGITSVNSNTSITLASPLVSSYNNLSYTINWYRTVAGATGDTIYTNAPNASKWINMPATVTLAPYQLKSIPIRIDIPSGSVVPNNWDARITVTDISNETQIMSNEQVRLLVSMAP